MASPPKFNPTAAGGSVVEPHQTDEPQIDHDEAHGDFIVKYRPQKFSKTGRELHGVGVKYNDDFDRIGDPFKSNDDDGNGISLGPEDLPRVPGRGASRNPHSLDVENATLSSLSSHSQLEPAISSSGPTYSVPSVSKSSQSHFSGEENGSGSKPARGRSSTVSGPGTSRDDDLARLTSRSLQILQDPGLRAAETSDWAPISSWTPLPWQDCDFSWSQDAGLLAFNGHPMPLRPLIRQDSIITCPRSPSDQTVVPNTFVFHSHAPVQPTQEQRSILMRTIVDEYVEAFVKFIAEVYLPTMALDGAEDSTRSHGGATSTDTHESVSSGNSANNKSSQGGLEKKRKRGGGHGNNDAGGSDEEDGYRNPKTTSRAAREEVEGERWACPFYAWCPSKSMAGCKIQMKKLSYVRNHLLDKHIKQYCRTCFGQIEDEEKNVTPHGVMELGIGCQITPRQPVSIIEEVSAKLVEVRYGTFETPVEAWRHMFRLIFPSEERIPSPFLDSQVADLLDHIHWVQRHLGWEIWESVVGPRKAENLFYLSEEDERRTAERAFNDGLDAATFCADHQIRLKPIPLGRDSNRYALELWQKTRRGTGNNAAENARCGNTLDHEPIGMVENSDKIDENELAAPWWNTRTLCAMNDPHPESEGEAQGCSGDEQQLLNLDWLKDVVTEAGHCQTENSSNVAPQWGVFLDPEPLLGTPASVSDGCLAAPQAQDSSHGVDEILADIIRTSAVAAPWAPLTVSKEGTDEPWHMASALHSTSSSVESSA